MPLQERAEVDGSRAFVVWLTGVPAAGKTTIARLLDAALHKRGVRSLVLDGDELRLRLSPELGFTRDDRDLHVRRVAYVASLLLQVGAVPIVALVSPYEGARADARGSLKRFVEVYVHCPPSVLRKRDPKGLYRRAAAGRISGLTGVDDPYEPPESPELSIDTSSERPEASLNRVLEHLVLNGYIAKGD